jgi:hypothetical protein
MTRKKHPADIETEMLYGKTQTMGIVHPASETQLDMNEGFVMHVTITTRDGEVLEHFAIQNVANTIGRASAGIRDYLEHRFECEEIDQP